MLLNMAIMKFTKQMMNRSKIERLAEITNPDLISLDCKTSSKMKEKFLIKKIQIVIRIISEDIGAFIRRIEKKLEELHEMVSMFGIDMRPASYRDMVGDEVRCKLQEWMKVVRNLKAEYKTWRTLSIRDQLLLIQLELDLIECKVLVSNFVVGFEINRSNQKGLLKINRTSAIHPVHRPTHRPEVVVGTLVDL